MYTLHIDVVRTYMYISFETNNYSNTLQYSFEPYLQQTITLNFVIIILNKNTQGLRKVRGQGL